MGRDIAAQLTSGPPRRRHSSAIQDQATGEKGTSGDSPLPQAARGNDFMSMTKRYFTSLFSMRS